MYRFVLHTYLFFVAMSGLFAADGEAKKPNIVVIFGDDIGQSNLSIYTKGLMGYRTPNIDRIAKKDLSLRIIMLNKVVQLAGLPL